MEARIRLNKTITNKNLVNKDLLKTEKSNELNILDKILTSDCKTTDKLRNDVRIENFQNELTKAKKNGVNQKRAQPTSVTLLNILGGKKNRKITYEGLRVLLDTGCSDSLVRAEYAKNGRIKK